MMDRLVKVAGFALTFLVLPLNAAACDLIEHPITEIQSADVVLLAKALDFKVVDCRTIASKEMCTRNETAAIIDLTVERSLEVEVKDEVQLAWISSWTEYHSGWFGDGESRVILANWRPSKKQQEILFAVTDSCGEPLSFNPSSEMGKQLWVPADQESKEAVR